jgi:hypothetical protein
MSGAGLVEYWPLWSGRDVEMQWPPPPAITYRMPGRRPTKRHRRLCAHFGHPPTRQATASAWVRDPGSNAWRPVEQAFCLRCTRRVALPVRELTADFMVRAPPGAVRGMPRA